MNARLSGADLSLNNRVSKDDNASAELIEFLPESRPTQETSLITREEISNKRALLTKAMSTLGERELEILTARKLMDEPLTLDELSSKYNISKERVRQIENRAFEKIQSFMLAELPHQIEQRG
jgi:RNA polymerase sigma-32 factor